MKKIIESILSDVDGQTSSKRVITLGAFLMLCTLSLLDVFTDYEIKPFVWDNMLYIVTAGVGFTTLEKFSRKKNVD